MMNDSNIIIGAGPAGLAAAYELADRGRHPIVLEKGDMVGGMARTVMYKGFRFDVGGHRFITNIEEIQNLWESILENNLIRVQRLSRIYYRKIFFRYPLYFSDVLTTLGAIESFMAFSSYIKSRIFPYREESSFEQWVSNRFGEYLYRTFFKTYSEKVWGIPGSKIRSEWARQRIEGLSLASVFLNALTGYQKSKSLASEFYYPRLGPGMMWEGFKKDILKKGGDILLNSRAVSVHHAKARVVKLLYRQNNDVVELPVSQIISSMPVNQLVAMLEPRAPDPVIKAADRLAYRSFIMVGLIIDREAVFPDQWLYIQDPEIRVGRIQNFNNWSPEMVPDHLKTALGMEYFCTIGDDLWSKSDQDLKDLASRELVYLGLLQYKDILDGFVIRQPDAYPVYGEDHQKNLKIIRDYLETIQNLQTIGRNGMHRYNNMDHSMYLGMLAARNITYDKIYNLWNHEETYPDIKTRKAPAGPGLEESVIRTFSRIDIFAFATAIGAVSGLFFFLITMWLIVKGGDIIGPNLQLLGQYFIGYSVTVKGSFIALVYGFIWGFIFGGMFAFFRNLFLSFYVYRIKHKAELLSFRDFFDKL